ncbi:ferrous iron transport protein A [Acidaminobacter sp. JC074]|nr:FeoA family protein [Acidaminobacter sp. JC074]MCH4891024.1 ferrous iron transport protein A [Acidaminobacter sp. JC074]
MAKSDEKNGKISDLSRAKINTIYEIKDIKTNDSEIENFLFTLGCYPGEKVVVISRLADNFVISVKDARYSIDTELAKAIKI